MKTLRSHSNTASPTASRSRTALTLAAIASLAVSFALLVSGCGDTTAKVPNTVNQTLTVAQQMLSDQGFKSSVTRVTSSQGKDEVLSQNPLGGTTQKTSDVIALTVSNGPGEGIIPDVAGDPSDRAQIQLEDAGFKPVTVQVFSSAHQAGFAVGTTPIAGTQAQKDSTVTLNISKGPQQALVPNVIGFSAANADSALTNAGFRVDHSYKASNKTPGQVLAQDPSGGVTAGIGSSVQVTIDQAPKQVKVPNAVGQTQIQGDRTLQNAGLDAVYVTRTVTSASQNGIVLAMSPGAGSTVAQGTNVVLTIGKYNNPTPPVPPAPAGSIVKKYPLQANQTKTYTATWSASKCVAGKGKATLSGNGGGSAMSGAQITAQGQPTDTAYYATTTTSDITSPVTLVITITCSVN